MSLKQNCSLFATLYVSCQVREGNLDEIFEHENSNFPPALSNLRLCTNSDLLECLENPNVQVLVIDGAVFVNILTPTVLHKGKEIDERRRVLSDSRVPENLQAYLRLEENKTDLLIKQIVAH
ncbi:hypothetical protein MAR_023787 [Mya arenaria]|uniref:Uncharacterized protein n=1 Tax=Mya arenaria TaxID=6604 RepID=A0ABY7DPT0_MYAAR|nr:hypothetical protein MAR_023787 [Mya arenaria]